MPRKTNLSSKPKQPFKLYNNGNNLAVPSNKSIEAKLKKEIFEIKKTEPKRISKVQKLIQSCNIIKEKEKFPSENKLNYSLTLDLEENGFTIKPKSSEDYLDFFVKEFKPREVIGIPNWLFENFKEEAEKKETDSKSKTASKKTLIKNKNNNIENTKKVKNYSSCANSILSSQKNEKKNICVYCNRTLNSNYLKYEHLCAEKNLSENSSLENIQNICPFCKCSFSRSYFLKHYRKCKKEGVWCDACEKKISFENLEKHNKQFHEKKKRKKRKGKTEWIRTRCEFCPKRIRLRNKHNHLLKCWGFRIFLTNPKIFNIKNFRKPNLYKRNWIKNKWVKVPFKVCKRVNIPKGYEIGCSYDLQGNKFVDFDEQQNLILPWIPEIAKPKNRKILIHDFLQRKTNRLPARNAKEICEKIKLQVELELLKRKLDKKYLNKSFNFDADYEKNKNEEEEKYCEQNEDKNDDDSVSEADEELVQSMETIKCYEIFIRLKENIEKMQMELLNFNLLPQIIQERNLSDKLYLKKELMKMHEINKIFNEAEDFQIKLREAENLDLETCFASDDEIECD